VLLSLTMEQAENWKLYRHGPCLGRRPPNGSRPRIIHYVGIYTPVLYRKRRSTRINHCGTGRQIKTAGNCIYKLRALFILLSIFIIITITVCSVVYRFFFFFVYNVPSCVGVVFGRLFFFNIIFFFFIITTKWFI
jgi:hypothetical protein